MPENFSEDFLGDIESLTVYKFIARWFPKELVLANVLQLRQYCAESDSYIIKTHFQGYKLLQMAQNIYSFILLKRLLHCYRLILSLVGISTVARKLASFDIPTRDNIHRYQCNNPILLNISSKIV